MINNKRMMTMDAAYERLCGKYGEVLAHGGNPTTYFAGVRLAKSIARAMQVDVQMVIDAATGK